MALGTVVVSKLNLRNGPGTSYLVMGSVVYGEKVNIITTFTETNGNVWGRLDNGYWICIDNQGFKYVTYTPIETFPANYRIKDDIIAGVVPNGTRPYIRVGLPSTVRMRGGKGTVILSKSWLDYLRKINTQRAYDYIFKPGSGWHNVGALNLVEQLTFSGNIVRVTSIEPTKFGGKDYMGAFIETAFNNEAPPAVAISPTPNKLHPLIHLFTTQYADRLDMTTNNRYPRIIPMANPGERLWMDVRDLVRL